MTFFCLEIQVRNVHNRRDLGVSFAEFMDHLESAGPCASPDGRLFDVFSLWALLMFRRNRPMVCQGHELSK